MGTASWTINFLHPAVQYCGWDWGVEDKEVWIGCAGVEVDSGLAWRFCDSYRGFCVW
jgi:hypothetical protein